MIQTYTRLTVADNSGAKIIRLINIPGSGRRRYAHVGDIVVCNVREAAPNSPVRKGEVVKAARFRRPTAAAWMNWRRESSMATVLGRLGWKGSNGRSQSTGASPRSASRSRRAGPALAPTIHPPGSSAASFDATRVRPCGGPRPGDASAAWPVAWGLLKDHVRTLHSTRSRHWRTTSHRA